MPNLPVLKPREVVALLTQLGFVEVRQTGSHKQYRHPDGRCTTAPCHPERDISPILLRQIAKDIGMTIEIFFAKEIVWWDGQTFFGLPTMESKTRFGLRRV